MRDAAAHKPAVQMPDEGLPMPAVPPASAAAVHKAVPAYSRAAGEEPEAPGRTGVPEHMAEEPAAEAALAPLAVQHRILCLRAAEALSKAYQSGILTGCFLLKAYESYH